MKKTRSTKRAFLMSGIALLVCFSMLVGSTYAWFTDSVATVNNKIVAGNLDVELYWSTNAQNWNPVDANTNIFSDSLWEPGYTEVVYLKVVNAGTLALKYILNVAVASETGSVNVNGEEFKLSDYIEYGVTPVTGAYATRAAAVAAVSGNPMKLNKAYSSPENQTLLPAQEAVVAMVVYMPASVGNDANYAKLQAIPTINLGINLLATQLEYENDSFDNKYDENADYVVNVGETKTFTSPIVKETLTNHGTVTVNGGVIIAPDRGFENHGNATLKDVDINAGSAAEYSNVTSGTGAKTEYNDVDIMSGGGGVGAVDGGEVVFNSGSVEVNSTSTSGRYLFYAEGAGTVITINGGKFDFNKTQNQKRAYIYAGTGTTVYVNGGTFGKASTRSGYTAGILGDGEVIITGGTFGFDPSAWVKTGYQAVKKGENWVVLPEGGVANDLDDIKEVFTNGGTVVLANDVEFDKITSIAPGKEVCLDLNGKTITVDQNTTSNTLIWVQDGAKLTVTGNGTINLKGVSTMAIFCPYGELVIENGNFIRDKIAPEDVTNATTGLFMGAKNSGCNVTINGGYFDPGYYDTNAAYIEEILAGTATFTETADDIAKRGQPGDANLVRTAIKDNVSVLLNHSGYGSFKVYGGTFVGANPAWGDEGCMLPTTPNYLRPWSYYQGALLAGQTFNENGLVIPDGYTITRTVNGEGIPVYTVEYSK